MKKVLYAAALLFLVTACTLKPESKPYTWEDDLHQRLLTDFSISVMPRLIYSV